MRKHLSVLALGARQTLGKVLLLLVVLAAVETGLFGWALWTYLPQEMGGGMAGPAPVEELMEAVKLRWVYAGGMTAVFAVLLLTGLELRGSRMAYTMCRLRISEEAAVLWQGAYNALCFLLLWAVQTALALGFCLWYMAAVGPAFVTGQTAFLAFCRSGVPQWIAAPGQHCPVGAAHHRHGGPGADHRRGPLPPAVRPGRGGVLCGPGGDGDERRRVRAELAGQRLCGGALPGGAVYAGGGPVDGLESG